MSTKRVKALFLAPNLATGGTMTWILSLMRHCAAVQWVGYVVCQPGKDWFTVKSLGNEVSKTCPIIGIASNDPDRRGKLKRAIDDSGAEIVVSWCVADLDQYWDSNLPLVVVSHATVNDAYGIEVLKGPARIATHMVGISDSACQPFAIACPGRQVQCIPNGVELPGQHLVAPDAIMPRSSLKFGTTQEFVAYHRARNTARLRMGLGYLETVVGFVSRLTHEKGAVRFAEAMALLPSNYRGVWIGPPQGSIVDQIKSVYPQAIVMPSVDPGRVYDWLAGLDVSVLPSEYESCGYTALEAWASGVPLVATDTGIVSQRGRNCTTIIPLGFTNQQLADAIVDATKREHIQAAYALSLGMTAKGMAEQWDRYLGYAAMTVRPETKSEEIVYNIHNKPVFNPVVETLSWEQQAVAMLRARRG